MPQEEGRLLNDVEAVLKTMVFYLAVSFSYPANKCAQDIHRGDGRELSSSTHDVLQKGLDRHGNASVSSLLINRMSKSYLSISSLEKLRVVIGLDIRGGGRPRLAWNEARRRNATYQSPLTEVSEGDSDAEAFEVF